MFTCLAVGGDGGLLASVTDSLNHSVNYTYVIGLLGSAAVKTITEPSSGGNHVFTTGMTSLSGETFSVGYTSNGGLYWYGGADSQLRATYSTLGSSGGQVFKNV